MPYRQRSPSVLSGTDADPTTRTNAANPTASDDALALAEAEAAEADAVAAAASARVRLIRERRNAGAAADADPNGGIDGGDATVGDRTKDIEESESGLEERADAAADARPLRVRRFRLPSIRLKLVAGVLTILLTLGFLGAGGYMSWRHHQVVDGQHQSAEFAAAASQGVVTLMSLDFNHAQEDIRRIVDSTTGDFKKDFERKADDFIKAAQESKVVIAATVKAVAVQSITSDGATVLVAVTTQGSNVTGKDQQPRSWRVSVDVRPADGQIKMAKVEFVP